MVDWLIQMKMCIRKVCQEVMKIVRLNSNKTASALNSIQSSALRRSKQINKYPTIEE